MNKNEFFHLLNLRAVKPNQVLMIIVLKYLLMLFEICRLT
jgi:hypothetical protein